MYLFDHVWCGYAVDGLCQSVRLQFTWLRLYVTTKFIQRHTSFDSFLAIDRNRFGYVGYIVSGVLDRLPIYSLEI